MEKFKSSMKSFGSSVSEGFGHAGDFCVDSYNGMKLSISSYFESKDYEEDLDSIIDSLHSHMKKTPNFNFSEDLKERLSQKKSYLLKQAGLMVGGSALTGAWAALESGNPAMVGEYALIGATGAVVIIVVTVSGIVFKRVTQNRSMSFTKTSKAFEIIKV
jgi:hypothetical protein